VDSFEWSKKYEVLSISRLDLRSLGFSNEQITRLSDEDMERIAEAIATTYPDFENRVRINVSLYLLQ